MGTVANGAPYGAVRCDLCGRIGTLGITLRTGTGTTPDGNDDDRHACIDRGACYERKQRSQPRQRTASWASTYQNTFPGVSRRNLTLMKSEPNGDI